MPNREAFYQATVLFIIPLGVLLVAWLIQRQYGAKLNSGTDLFVFLAALDLTYLAKTDSALPRINPDFLSVYSPLFVCSLIASLAFLCCAAIIQGQIQRWLHRQARYYPLGGVFCCWLFALASIDFHMFILLGGQNK